jgi:hypothetical protein
MVEWFCSFAVPRGNELKFQAERGVLCPISVAFLTCGGSPPVFVCLAELIRSFLNSLLGMFRLPLKSLEGLSETLRALRALRPQRTLRPLQLSLKLSLKP